MSDVVFVGGGVIGLCAAWRAAQAGMRVIVLERGAPGEGASWASGGILGAQVESDVPTPTTDLAFASRGMFAALAAELREATGMDVAYERCGSVRVVRGAPSDEAALEQARALWERVVWQRARAETTELLDARALREAEPSLGPDVRAGVRFAADAHLDPRALVVALAAACRRRGVELRAGTPVAELAIDDGHVRGVRLADGSLVAADRVVVCAGAWTSLLPGLPRTLLRVRPVRGQIARLSSADVRLRSVVFTDGGYLVPRRDGDVLAGSTMEEAGFRAEPTAGGIAHVLGVAITLAPNLRQARVADAWAGLRPASADGLPLIGPTEVDGLLVATGHFRDGILLAPVTAAAITALLGGNQPAHDLGPVSALRVLPSAPTTVL